MARADHGAAGAARFTIPLCFLVAMLEGFDIQAPGVAAPRLVAQLGIAPGALGLFFSASTVGMLGGAFLGGRLADRFGRKGVLLSAVAAFAVFSLVTALAGSVPFLVGARFLTGLGLGGALPALIALASEHDPARRSRAVALMYAGTPLGGAFAGLVSAWFPTWQPIFLIGGGLPLLIVPLLWAVLVETHRPEPANTPVGIDNTRGFVSALFGGGRAGATLTLWLAFFCGMLVLYLMMNWTPTLLASRGFPQAQIAAFQAVLNVAGAAGVFAMSRLLDGRRLLPLLVGAYGLTAIMLGIVANMPTGFAVVILIACFFGAALLTAQSILYATAPLLYPEDVRATGSGAAVGVGRIGSVAGPLLAAAILSMGTDAVGVILSTIPIVLVGAVANFIAVRRAAARNLESR